MEKPSLEQSYTLSQEPNGYVIINGVKYVKEEPKEETFVISMEQIDCLCDKNEVIQKLMREWFPSAFVEDKKELVLEFGKWYKSGRSIFNHQESKNSYGFRLGKWQDGNWLTEKEYFIEVISEATKEEVEEALKNEAVKRGFKEHTFIKDLFEPNCGSLKQGYDKNECSDEDFQITEFGLFIGNLCVFHKGKWAEIIPTITKSEAEQKLNCKII